MEDSAKKSLVYKLIVGQLVNDGHTKSAKRLAKNAKIELSAPSDKLSCLVETLYVSANLLGMSEDIKTNAKKPQELDSSPVVALKQVHFSGNDIASNKGIGSSASLSPTPEEKSLQNTIKNKVNDAQLPVFNTEFGKRMHKLPFDVISTPPKQESARPQKKKEFPLQTQCYDRAMFERIEATKSAKQWAEYAVKVSHYVQTMFNPIIREILDSVEPPVVDHYLFAEGKDKKQPKDKRAIPTISPFAVSDTAPLSSERSPPKRALNQTAIQNSTVGNGNGAIDSPQKAQPEQLESGEVQQDDTETEKEESIPVKVQQQSNASNRPYLRIRQLPIPKNKPVLTHSVNSVSGDAANASRTGANRVPLGGPPNNNTTSQPPTHYARSVFTAIEQSKPPSEWMRYATNVSHYGSGVLDQMILDNAVQSRDDRFFGTLALNDPVDSPDRWADRKLQKGADARGKFRY